MESALTKSTLAIAIAIVALVLAGCGGSSHAKGSTGTSSGETGSSSGSLSLVASIEAICARRNKAIAAVGTTVESQQELKRVAGQRATVEQATLNELSRLTSSVTNQASWQQFLGYRRELAHAWAAVAEHGVLDPLGKGRTPYMETVVTSQKAMIAVAKRAGYKTCTQVD